MRVCVSRIFSLCRQGNKSLRQMVDEERTMLDIRRQNGPVESEQNANAGGSTKYILH